MKKLLPLLMLFSCGGGSVPNSGIENPNVGISVPVYDYRDYAPMRESRTGEGSFGKWISEVKDPNTIDVHWPPSIEEFRIRDYAGEPWVILDAYNGPFRNVIRTTRVEIKYGDGPWISLPTGPGNPYTPVNITQRFTLRQWGWVSGACGQSGVPDEQCGDNSVRYFWQHTITPRGQIMNICWHDALTNTRETLMQQEAWWSTGVGWHPRSTPGEMKDGLPTGENIVYLWHQTIAKGAGYLWTSTTYCLVR